MRKAPAGQLSPISQRLIRLKRSWQQLITISKRSIYAAIVIFCATLGFIFPAAAQVQRSFINLGFEEPQLNPNAPDCPSAWALSTVMPASDVPGWSTTHPSQLGWCTNNGGTTGFQSQTVPAPLIDIWKSEKVVGIPSRSGVQHAELNAFEASRIYQTVCLLEDETVNWRFSHRARGDVTGGGAGLDKMRFKISTQAGVDFLNIADAESDANGNGQITSCNSSITTCNPTVSYTVPGGPATARHWIDYSGTLSWNQPSANYQFGFEALTSAGLGLHEGNLIDDIQLTNLTPFVELSSDAYSSQEGSTSNLAILFSGLVTGAPITVQVEVTPVTATAGTDYTAPQTINITIPPDPNGYSSRAFSFASQIQILSDALEEAPETFKLKILPSSSFLIQNTRVCGLGNEYAEATYTILDAHISTTKAGTHVDLNGNGKKDADDRIDYTITVNNTGSVPITDLQVNDPLLGGNLISTPTTLAAGGTNSVTGSYIINASDMLTGKVSNTATATANTPNGPVPPKSASYELILDVDRSLDFIKAARTPSYVDANTNGQIDAGEQVPFDFTIINTGNVDAIITAVTDDLSGFQFQGLTLPASLAALPAGQQITFSGYHLATQTEIDAGEIINGAEATYSAAGQTIKVRSRAPAGGAQTKITIPEPTASSILSVTKEIVSTAFGSNGVADEDEAINYKITVTNNSSLTLNNLTFQDAKLSLSQSLATLGPWQSHSIGPLPYMLTQPDIDAGTVSNTASATGQSPRGTSLSASDAIQYPLNAIPSIDFLKEANFVNLVGSELPEIGDRVDYTFTVTNTGNVTIANYTISDPIVLVEKTREPPALLPNTSDSTTYKASKFIALDDLNSGRLENIATLSGVTTGNIPVTATSHGPDGHPTIIQFTQNAAVGVQLTGTWLDENGNGMADAGERVDYRAVVTNPGNVQLTDILISGIMPTAGLPANARAIALPIAETIASLSPGNTHNVQFYYVLTQLDIEQGILGAQLMAVGQGPATLPPETRSPQQLSDDPTSTAAIDPNGSGQPIRPSIVNLPQLVRLKVDKSGGFLGTGLAAAGTQIEYTVNISNTGNVTITEVAPVDAGPTFSGTAGTGHLSSFTPEKVDLAPGDPPASFKAIYTMSAGDVAQSIGTVGSVKNISQATGKTRNGATPEVIPGEVELTPPGITINKQANISEALRGSQVPYTITLESHSLKELVPVRLVDIVPRGFVYVSGTATLNGVALDPRIEGQSLLFDEILVAHDKKTEINLALTVGSSVKRGTHTNRALLFYPNSVLPLAPEATAPIEVVTEAYFDCGDVIGKVFNDVNRNGYQDTGEDGLPGARIVTAQGMLITTDQHGRFSVACADLPDSRIGSTYIMKLDPRSMPSGYRIISENPRTVRLSAGKVTRLNFATSIARVVRVDLVDAAFVPAQIYLRPEWETQLQQLIKTLETEESILKISYIDAVSGQNLGSKRVNQLRKTIEKLWQSANNNYRLEIETRVVTAEK